PPKVALHDRQRSVGPHARRFAEEHRQHRAEAAALRSEERRREPVAEAAVPIVGRAFDPRETCSAGQPPESRPAEKNGGGDAEKYGRPDECCDHTNHFIKPSAGPNSSGLCRGGRRTEKSDVFRDFRAVSVPSTRQSGGEPYTNYGTSYPDYRTPHS